MIMVCHCFVGEGGGGCALFVVPMLLCHCLGGEGGCGCDRLAAMLSCHCFAGDGGRGWVLLTLLLSCHCFAGEGGLNPNLVGDGGLGDSTCEGGFGNAESEKTDAVVS